MAAGWIVASFVAGVFVGILGMWLFMVWEFNS
jgi:hypothetical protein